MKKLWILFLVLALIGSAFVGCGTDEQVEDPDDEPGDASGDPGEDGPVYDLSDTSAYTVVVSEYASGIEETAARTVRTAIEAKYGAKPKLSSDWLTGAPSEEEVASWREILVGKAERPERRATSEELELGFVIRVTGNKVIILGVNDEQTLKAAEYFAEILLPTLDTGLACDFIYTERYEAKLIKPTYSDEPVVAEIVATDIPYYADPTGKTDSTYAIQAALDACAERGGGTVWLPAGKYLVTSTLYLEPGVILRGDWQDPETTDAPAYGTVILADPEPLHDHERDDLSAKPLVNLFSNSGVIGLTFYYPNQNAADPVPYGYTIHSYSNNTATVRDITLLNSYRGVGASLVRGDGHCIMQLESLRICALESGVEMDVSRDVGYTVDVRISPSYWAEASGSYKCADAAALRAFCRENTVGLTIKSLDDEHFSTLDIEGCRTAIHMTTPVNGAAYWGLIYDVNIADCTFGIVADRVNDYGGISIAKATIDADEYALVSRAGTGVIKLCGLELTGKGDVVAANGARIIWDEETDVSDYEIDYGDYTRPADRLYIAPVAALSETKKDISSVLQDTLDEAGKTGGIVYLPAGFYTLTEPVHVPDGVQLRGAMDIYTYTYVESEVCGSVILSYVDGDATVTLGEGAGINGLVIFAPTYAPDYALELIEDDDDAVEESVTIRGEGDGVYVINSTLLGNFVGIDFTDCDDHLIREAFGCTLRAFARVGGKGGVVERVMNTFHMIDRNPLGEMGVLDGQLCDMPAWVATSSYEAEAISTLRDDLLRTHYNVIELVGAEGEQVSNVFMFTPARIVYAEQSAATLLNISSDAHGLEPMFEITESSDVVAINVLRSGGRSLSVDDSSEFKLYNRVAISDWYEPSFDSTRGDNQERTYKEYGERFVINDGTVTDGVEQIEGYEGSEFSASGNTSLHYTSSVSTNVDTVFVQRFDTPADLSAYMNEDGYLHLWVHIDDLTNVWWSGYIQLESASGGSIRWATSTSLRRHGVNELYLPLTGAVMQGSFDATRVSAIRFTNQVGVTLEHPEMYIDDVYVTLAEIDQPIDLVEQSTVEGLEAATPLRLNVPATPLVDRDIVDGKLMMFDCETGDGTLLLTKNPAYVKEGKGAWRVSASGGASSLTVTFDPLDISSFMEDGYLHMWVYVDGKLRIKDGQIELSSSGTCDVQEIYWNASTYLREGWNELRLSLTGATERPGSEFDPTCLNYMRIYFHTSDGLVPTVYYDDIYFYDATPVEGATAKPTGSRKLSFTVGEADEKRYLGDKQGSLSAGKVRYADKTNAIIYKYTLAVTEEMSHLSWRAKIGQQLHLQASTDGATWVDIYQYDGSSTDRGLPMSVREYDLLPFLREHTTGKNVALYLRVADASTDTGWGGAISVDVPVTLHAYYGDFSQYVPEPDEPEVKPDTPSVPSDVPDFTGVPVGEYEAYQVMSFVVNTEAERQYLTADKGTFIEGKGKSRYADKTNKIIYAYPISDLSTLSRLVWVAPTGQQLHLQVSLDKASWVDVYRYKGVSSDTGLAEQLRAYDLLAPIASLLGKEQKAMLYVKVSDAYTDMGWGGSVGISHPVTLHAVYGEVDADKDPLSIVREDGTADPNRAVVVTQSMSLLNCDTMAEGVSQVALNTDPSFVKEGGASYRHDGGHVWLQVNFAQPIDISDYVETGYLHLWIYVGDTPLSYKDGQIEIGSGGREDVSEWCWYMNAHVTSAGWTELYLPLSGAHEGREPVCDPTSINFLRLYAITADGSKPVVYLDDISVCK